MSRYVFIVCFLLCVLSLQGQESNVADSKYLEDQVYVSFTYNILTNKTTDITQNGLSGGLSIGFIKDIPLNEERNIGMAIGLGYAYNRFSQNLKISTENTTVFEIAQNYTTNKFGLSSVEMPIELRWRNSTPTRYKFWRVYGGLKLSYLVLAKTTFEDANGKITTKNIPEFEKLKYGLTLATGYSTWNLYLYYGLNPLFNDVEYNGEKLDLKNFNIGLKFYIM